MLTEPERTEAISHRRPDGLQPITITPAFETRLEWKRVYRRVVCQAGPIEEMIRVLRGEARYRPDDYRVEDIYKLHPVRRIVGFQC